MRLHVGEPTATGSGVRVELLGWSPPRSSLPHTELAPAESVAVAVADVRSDHDTQLAAASQTARIVVLVAGVEAARDVRARHEREQARASVRPLADIGVEIDRARHAVHSRSEVSNRTGWERSDRGRTRT